MTNDGDWAQRLLHPRHEIEREYAVGLDRPITDGESRKLLAGVSLALLHNFCWHLRWTWGDRRLTGSRAVQAFLSFVAANGVVSFGGNIVIMIALVTGAGVPVLPANLVAIAVCGLVNFWLGDTIAFSPSASQTSIPTTSR